jgi:hypothetical protein
MYWVHGIRYWDVEYFVRTFKTDIAFQIFVELSELDDVVNLQIRQSLACKGRSKYFIAGPHEEV